MDTRTFTLDEIRAAWRFYGTAYNWKQFEVLLLAAMPDDSRSCTACRPWCGLLYDDDHVPFRLDDKGMRRVWFDDDARDGDLNKQARCSQACRDRAKAVPRDAAPLSCPTKCGHALCVQAEEYKFQLSTRDARISELERRILRALGCLSEELK